MFGLHVRGKANEEIFMDSFFLQYLNEISSEALLSRVFWVGSQVIITFLSMSYLAFHNITQVRMLGIM